MKYTVLYSTYTVIPQGKTHAYICEGNNQTLIKTMNILHYILYSIAYSGLNYKVNNCLKFYAVSKQAGHSGTVRLLWS